MIERIEINLLPAEYRIRKRTINISRSIIYPAVVAVALACGAGFYSIYMKNAEAELNDDIQSLEKEIAANAHIQAEINKVREEKKVTEEKINALQRINVNREKWVRLLEVFSGKLPAYTWLMEIKEVPENKLAVEARTYSFPEVAHYMSRLEDDEYISSVDLTGIEQINAEGRKAYRFSITCAINKDAGMGALPGGKGE
jgi:Tfp pilus assembly protein PilN